MSWSLNFVKPLKPIQSPSPLAEEWDDLPAREADVGIQIGQPVLLPPSGRPDVNVVRYLNSGSFKKLSIQTQESYAKDLKLFFTFLDSQQKTWLDAAEDDLENYEFWRRRDPRNSFRISGAKFSRELAAIDRFYKWQVAKGVLKTSPVAVRTTRQRNGDMAESLALAQRNVRRSNVKWLTARAYRQWRDVGLGGYLPDGLRDQRWRGRTRGRNVAFSELLWSSGLRLTEGAPLLSFELPDLFGNERFVRGCIGEAVAKGGSKRDFWVAAHALDRVASYMDVDRRLSVRRAQSEGRYNELENLLLLQQVSANRVAQLVDSKGKKIHLPLDQLTAEMRTRVFIERDDQIEPVSLWLTEGGMPLPVETWETVFATANERCKQHDVKLYCHPHMLRHSFALKMLVTLMHVFERRMSITSEERREYRMIFGDPWSLVQTLLGHRSSEVTREIYLEPVNGIQIDLFLNDSLNEEGSIDELLSKIASDSGLVADLSPGGLG